MTGLGERSEMFRVAQQLAAEAARAGQRPGRYEIKVTAQVWPGDAPQTLEVADVVFTWHWYPGEAEAGVPGGGTASSAASTGGGSAGGSAGGHG